MKTVIISDSVALGVMEVRPEPAWRVNLTDMRNKDLLSPDYGAMYVAAHLRGLGHRLEVINTLADLHCEARLFRETNPDPRGYSAAPIASTRYAQSARRHLFDSLEERRPEIILFTLSSYNLALYSRRLLREVREACQDAFIVAGGVYSTFHAHEILSDGGADAVVRGEGEETCAELLEALGDDRGPGDVAGLSYRRGEDITHNPPRAPLSDLDSLPHIYTVSEEFRVRRRFEVLSELLPHGDWIPGAGFLTSRGCPEMCTFCLDPAINSGRVRFHSPGYVRRVLEYCREHFSDGAGAFFFADATFTMNRKRLFGILDRLEGMPFTYQIQTRADYLDAQIIEKLASSGFTTVAIGAETFNERVLREVVKKRMAVSTVIESALAVKRAGMEPVLTFIVGLPGETRESVWRTVEMLKENDLLTSTFFPLVVFRGTALYEEFARRHPGAEAEPFRLNPYSEEYLFAGEEFATKQELTAFTEDVNSEVLGCRC